MSDQQAGPPQQGPPGDEEQLSPEQEQMLRQMEEEMSRMRVQDLLAQSVVNVLNLSYRRIAKEGEQDLDQARVGIDAVTAVAGLLDPEAEKEVRDAISQVQMAYGQASGSGSGSTPEATTPSDAPEPGAGPSGQDAGGARKPPPRLWTPGSG